MIDTTWLTGVSTDTEAVELTSQLVSYRSFPGQEGEVQRAVAAWFKRHGIPAELQPTGAEDRPNVIAQIENGPGPTVLLNGHIDTVLEAAGWSADPWTARRDGDRLYGLGASDMKGGVAAIMLATRALDQRRDCWRGTVICTSVVDEEAYSIGARAIVDAGIRADACIVTEPAFTQPIIGGVGKVLIRGDVTGKAAHGSWPEQGINAAMEGARLLARLDQLPLGRHPHLKSSQCLLSFLSGSDQYVITVPERARFLINRHIVPGETAATVLAEMRTLASQLHSPARFEFSIDPPYYPPWQTDPDGPVVAQFVQAYAAEMGRPPAFGYAPNVSDANYFSADLGIPTIYFGPEGDRLHQSDEWVAIPTLGGTIRVLLRFISRFTMASAVDSDGLRDGGT